MEKGDFGMENLHHKMGGEGKRERLREGRGLRGGEKDRGEVIGRGEGKGRGRTGSGIIDGMGNIILFIFTEEKGLHMGGVCHCHVSRYTAHVQFQNPA